MWSNNKGSGSGSSSSPTKRANLRGYLGNGKSFCSHSRLLEDNDDDANNISESHHSSLLEDELELRGAGPIAIAASASATSRLLEHTNAHANEHAASPQRSSSSAESDASSVSTPTSLPPIHENEDCNDLFDASLLLSTSTVRISSRKIIEMDGNSFDLDDIEEAYMLSVWSNADVDMGGLGSCCSGNGSVYSGRSCGKATASTCLSSSSIISSSSSSTATSTTTRHRHRGAARKRLVREEQTYDPTSNTQGWVASFHVAAEIHNCGDWEPQTGFFKRQPFHLPPIVTQSSASSSPSASPASVWQEPTPFDYCKKERIEV